MIRLEVLEQRTLLDGGGLTPVPSLDDTPAQTGAADVNSMDMEGDVFLLDIRVWTDSDGDPETHDDPGSLVPYNTTVPPGYTDPLGYIVTVNTPFYVEIIVEAPDWSIGVIEMGIDLDWDPSVLDEINDDVFPGDDTKVSIPLSSDLVTSEFPDNRSGSRDNVNGFIDQLRGGGGYIGYPDPEQFSLMHFQGDLDVIALCEPLTLLLDETVGLTDDFDTYYSDDEEVQIESRTVSILEESEITVTDSSGPDDDASIQFGTPLEDYRPTGIDSPLVRPHCADGQHYVIAENTGATSLVITETHVNVPNVTVTPNLGSGSGDDITLGPGETQQFDLVYTPTRPSYSLPVDPTNENFAEQNGLVIESSALNAPVYGVTLRGTSTFNSDVNYDGKVDLADLSPISGSFGKSSADPGWDPGADANGDGVVNLGDLSPLNSEWNLKLPLVMLTQSSDSTAVAEGGATDTYTLALNRAPTHDVVVDITVPDGQTEVDITQWTFTTGNWNSPKTITVTAVDDSDYEGSHSSVIVHTVTSDDTEYDGVPVTFYSSAYHIPVLSDWADLTVAVSDNDPPPPGGAGQAGDAAAVAPSWAYDLAISSTRTSRSHSDTKKDPATVDLLMQDGDRWRVT